VTAASSPIGRPSGRRERLARERTEGMLRRQAQLESEFAEQLEPLLGPAGGPVGGTARAIWRRRRVDAYLALPPWRRAARTWTAWGRVHRATTVLALAALWTVACLPLRMLGLASLEVSQIGVAVIACLAPVAAVIPPGRRGRFARPLPEAAPPWRGSRHGRTLLHAGSGVLAVAAIALGVLAVAGPGPASPPEGRITAAARQADVRLVDREVARLCGPAAVATVSPDGLHRYAVAVDGGGGSRADVVRTGGFDDAGGRAVIAAGVAVCPAP
jgi:hypothetical protein